jgi:hypothetical protein
VIDHILLDIIGALRGALEEALLERLAAEERFAVDVFVGDITFGTSYGLPGEPEPSRVRADITLEWSTWSQSTYRSWSIGEPTSERPELVVEVAFRLDDLVTAPDPGTILRVLGTAEPALSGDVLRRQPVLVERRMGADSERSAIEVAFGGAWRLVDALLEDPAAVERELTAMARFIASALVRLADLDLATLGPDPAPPPRT